MKTRIIPDANLFLALAVPLPYSERSEVLVRLWERSLPQLHAPVLWEYEISAGLRRAAVLNLISTDDGAEALKWLLSFGIEITVPTPELHSRAYRWANRLDHDRVYAAHYLALAETLGAEFWSADRRLVQWLRHLGTNWVHCILD